MEEADEEQQEDNKEEADKKETELWEWTIDCVRGPLRSTSIATLIWTCGQCVQPLNGLTGADTIRIK